MRVIIHYFILRQINLSESLNYFEDEDQVQCFVIIQYFIIGLD